MTLVLFIIELESFVVVFLIKKKKSVMNSTSLHLD